MPTRVLLVANTTEYGGAEKHLLQLVQRLKVPGIEASILCLGPDFYTERQAVAEVIHVRPEKQPRSFRAWRRLLQESRPDIVVFVCGWLFAFSWYSSLAARLAGARRVFSLVHLMPDPVPATLPGRPVRNVLRRLAGGQLRMRAMAWSSTATICVSEAIRECLVRQYRFPGNRTVTVYNGISVTDFAPSPEVRLAVREKLGIRAEDIVLVCAARLNDVKRIDILLDAMASVSRSGANCRCLIIGDGPSRDKLLAQARELSLDGAVSFEGFQADVRPYLQAADAFILTSGREGLPISILEAMSCGLPCVVTNVGGNAEAIHHNIQGFVVPPGSVAAVTDSILRLVRDPEDRGKMSMAARARACEVFDLEKRMAQLVRLVLN
jgi:glycosyltransferase involved in cell wall biosynthesis